MRNKTTSLISAIFAFSLATQLIYATLFSDLNEDARTLALGVTQPFPDFNGYSPSEVILTILAQASNASDFFVRSFQSVLLGIGFFICIKSSLETSSPLETISLMFAISFATGLFLQEVPVHQTLANLFLTTALIVRGKLLSLTFLLIAVFFHHQTALMAGVILLILIWHESALTISAKLIIATVAVAASGVLVSSLATDYLNLMNIYLTTINEENPFAFRQLRQLIYIVVGLAFIIFASKQFSENTLQWTRIANSINIAALSLAVIIDNYFVYSRFTTGIDIFTTHVFFLHVIALSAQAYKMIIRRVSITGSTRKSRQPIEGHQS